MSIPIEIRGVRLLNANLGVFLFFGGEKVIAISKVIRFTDIFRL